MSAATHDFQDSMIAPSSSPPLDPAPYPDSIVVPPKTTPPTPPASLHNLPTTADPSSQTPSPTTSTTTTTSGLPTSYYERYTRNYNLGERQRTLREAEQRALQQRLVNASKGRSSRGRRGSDPGGGTGNGKQAYYGGENPSTESLASSDHLESAVENLYKMVERKVAPTLPPSPRRPTVDPSQYPVPRNPTGRRRADSWTSTAIHSEVSKLYHMGAATAGSGPRQTLITGPNNASERDLAGATRTGLDLESGKRGGGEASEVSLDLLLLIYGFLFPPLWWYGAFRAHEPPSRYRKYNRILSVVGTILYLGVAAFLVWFFLFR